MEVKYVIQKGKGGLKVIKIDKDGERDVTDEYNNHVLPGYVDYSKRGNRFL